MTTRIFVIFITFVLSACDQTQDSHDDVIGNNASGPSGAMTLFIQATIHTLDQAQPQVDAMAINREGRIVALATSAELKAAYPDAQVHDLQGATVVPGLIDAHGHLLNLGMGRMRVDLAGADSKAEILRRLREHAAALPEGAWLMGRGWDQNDWPEQVFPSKHDLDAAFPQRPVWLRRIDGHAGWANSAALSQVSRDLSGDWQVAGGLIQRNEQGEPSGIFIDGAMALIDQAVPPPSAREMNQALDLALAETARLGLTGVHDAGASWPTLQMYLRYSERGQLPIRVYAMADGDGETLRQLCANGSVEDVAGRVISRSVKLYADGALGSRGAALQAPYSDAPETSGLLFHRDEALTALVKRAMACGLQVNTHAIGDAANRQVLEAYALAMDEVVDHVGRHRIEHAQIVQLDDIPMFKELGLIASMQPTHATSDMPWAEERVGPQRILGGYAWRRFDEAGVRLALGSDFPVESADPLWGIYAAISRQDHVGQPQGGWYADQRLSAYEALKGFTLDAAYAAFMEDEVGSLSVGKRADFVVLDRDILNIPADQILQTQVLATWLDGQPVYRASEK